MSDGIHRATAMVLGLIIIMPAPLSANLFPFLDDRDWNDDKNVLLGPYESRSYEIANGSKKGQWIDVRVKLDVGGPIEFTIAYGSEVSLPEKLSRDGEMEEVRLVVHDSSPHFLIVKNPFNTTSFYDAEWTDPYGPPEFWQFWFWEEMYQICCLAVLVIIIILIFVTLHLRKKSKRKMEAKARRARKDWDGETGEPRPRRPPPRAGWRDDYYHYGRGRPPPRQYPSHRPYSRYAQPRYHDPYDQWQVPAESPYAQRRRGPPPGPYAPREPPPGPAAEGGASAPPGPQRPAQPRVPPGAHGEQASAAPGPKAPSAPKPQVSKPAPGQQKPVASPGPAVGEEDEWGTATPEPKPSPKAQAAEEEALCTLPEDL